MADILDLDPRRRRLTPRPVEVGLSVHAYPLDNVLRPGGDFLGADTVGAELLVYLRQLVELWCDPAFEDSVPREVATGAVVRAARSCVEEVVAVLEAEGDPPPPLRAI